MTGNTWITLGAIALTFSAVAIPYGFYLKSNQQAQIKQETAGERSPNIIKGTTSVDGSINQKSSGPQSPNIISGTERGSVSVVYDAPQRKNDKSQEDKTSENKTK
jgi:hypothetical protein